MRTFTIYSWENNMFKWKQYKIHNTNMPTIMDYFVLMLA